MSKLPRGKKQDTRVFEYPKERPRRGHARRALARQRRRTALLFGSVFAVSLVSLSALAFGVLYYADVSAQEPSSSQDAYTGLFHPDEKHNLTMLSVSSTGELFVLLRLDVTGKNIRVCTLPKQLNATVGVKTKSLERFFHEDGMGVVQDAVENATGIRATRYAVFDRAAMTAFTDAMGGVSLDVPFDTVCTDALGGEVVIGQGEQFFDGEKLCSYLTSPQLRSGFVPSDSQEAAQEDRLNAVTGAVVELLNQNLKTHVAPDPDRVFDAVINRIETNITQYDHTIRRDAYAYLTAQVDQPALAVLVDGTYEGDDFTLSETSRQALHSAFAGA